ncbi:PQ-loop domain-containing transporter [Nocardioides sp. YIM 152315]|uniref:PQ-loop domain-containing transporter n=1 Tax=Nocardioides sp. YIM 152315 TaxID=3031760 RepID=UPI0023DA42CF|nr:PQ-loop domain-containing transporter [Nocardioides sp. YIM 152315]MDF1605339.1 PQ-loop domain-containing transporter [Nocardioides sp. YIM 152315]
MNLSLATLLGLAATLLAVAYTLPQVRKLVRSGTAAGVSVAALANSTVSGTAWTAYGVVEHEVWVILPALLTLPGTAGAMAIAWRRGGDRDRMWLPVAWASALTALTALVPLLGSRPIVVALGCSITLMVVPAAATAWRSPDVSAIAASAWAMLIVDAALTGGYGLLADIDANLIYALVAASGSVLILTRLAVPPHVHARLVRLPGGIDPDVTRDDLSLVA